MSALDFGFGLDFKFGLDILIFLCVCRDNATVTSAGNNFKGQCQEQQKIKHCEITIVLLFPYSPCRAKIIISKMDRIRDLNMTIRQLDIVYKYIRPCTKYNQKYTFTQQYNILDKRKWRCI